MVQKQTIKSMKTLLSLLLFTTLLKAQDKRFTLSAQTELADKNTHNQGFDYGFNLGLELNYQRSIMYNSAEIYVFPDLNGMDYFHAQATLIGFNHHSFNEQWRLYLGALKGGFILRDGGPHAMVGFDFGIEHYFENGMFIGIESGYDWKMDDKTWDVNGTGHGVWFNAFKIGITL